MVPSRRKRRRDVLSGILYSLVLLTFGWAFCGELWSDSPAAGPKTQITVSAAASLKDALSAIVRDFEGQHTDVQVALNFGGSGTLELQIEQGAPVDAFISASSEDMDKLAAKKLLIPDSRFNLLRNELVLIVPRDATAIHGISDLTKTEVSKVAIGDPRTVPAGEYARQTLASVGLYDTLKPKLVLTTDVRQVLADVETASAQAGFVYSTDAMITNGVRVVAEAPANSHRLIVYPAAVLRDSRNAREARSFLSFLRSTTARMIFEKSGFKLATE